MKKTIFLTTLAAAILASCAGERGNYPDGLPRALRTGPVDGPMPEYISEVDSSLVTITFLGDSLPEDTRLNMFLISTSDYEEILPVTVGGDGVAQVRLLVPGTSQLQVQSDDNGMRYGTVWIKPGEDTRIYVDNRPDSVRGEGRLIYTDGFYSNLNAMASKYPLRHILTPFSPGVGSYDLTGDEYMAAVRKAYSDSVAALEADTIPQLAKDMVRAEQKAALLGMAMVSFINRGTWFEKHPDMYPVPDSIRLVLEPRHIGELYDMDDLDDKSILMAPSFLTMALEQIDFTADGSRKGLVSDLATYQKTVKKASSGKLSGEDLAGLRTMDNGAFYAEVASKAQAGYEKKFNEAVNMIKQLPEGTPGDKIIETIAAAHKGKVVVIDLWNTWCGPCKAAIAENEPVKATELSSPDIDWVYIADESSPMNLYVNMIPGIRGDHYRISTEQAKALHSQFNVDGIPYYIIVDRQGNFQGRPDLRDHDLYKKTILGLL